MSSHKLRFESRAADGSIGLSLMRDQNIVGQDKVQAGDFGDLDEICKKLNNDQNRSIAADMGADLFDRIFVTGGTLRNYWDSLDDDTRGLPLELVIEDAELAAYPWELLRDADDNMPAQLGGMIRRSQVPALPRDLAEWPLRFLVILGTLDAKINGKVEFDNLRRDLLEVGRSVDVCCVELPSSDEVRKVLKEYQPHVIHFIGHSEEGGLWIANKTNAWAWKTAVIKADMKNADCAPLLVFLNSCRSAVEPSKAVTRRASASVQAAFARRAACVIAMQADVQGERAMKFSRAFYRLALKPNGDPPDFMPIAEAVREARRALTDDDQELDWALPTLTFNTSEMDFSTRLGRRPKYARVLTCGEFEDTKLFANCETGTS